MTTTGKAASVTFDKVTKIYGEVVALHEVSFTVEPGNLVTLLGPSGCGKTTTLRLIAGLEMPTNGRILIGDADVTRLPATQRDISMVFQSYALFPHMTVLENVSYGLVVSGRKKAEAHAIAEDGLLQVGLGGYGGRLPSELSGGQQQRVAVARALVLEPQVLLFDEPLSNLDAKLRRRVREEIRELQKSLGLTTIYVTHDQEEALAVSDRIIVMREARIAQQGRPRELYETPVDRFVADFIGDANLVEGEITEVNGSLAVVRVGEAELRLPHRNLAPGPVELAIRPEAIELSTDPAVDAIAGTITKAIYLGSRVEYLVGSPLGELFAVDARVETPIAAGSPVSIRLAERGVSLIPR